MLAFQQRSARRWTAACCRSQCPRLFATWTNATAQPLRLLGLTSAALSAPPLHRRYLPDNSYEDWSLSELIIPER